MSDKPLRIRATIEVEGSPSDVAAWLAKLPRDSSSQNGAATDWALEDARALVARISDRARDALWFMVKSAPAISFKELQNEMGVNGLGMGGVLASFGFAERAGFSRPYVVDHTKRQYRVDPEVAELFADVLQDDHGY